MNEKIFETLSGKYKIALLTTYNLDLEYFDNNIFYKFFANGIKDVSIFVDSNQLQESLKKHKTNLGIRYSVIPFKMSKSFHPKVILLLDDTKAKLVVGSLNLTEKGYSHNQEIYNCFEYDKEHQENINLIIDAYKFFLRLNELSEEHDEEILNRVASIPYLNRNDVNGKTKLISSLDESIYKQALSNIEGTIKHIDIAVPYYDNEASALFALENYHPEADIQLYIQNEKSTFPQKMYENYKSKIIKFRKITCNECGNFYHGKVFRFITDNSSYILYGSANCTNAALMKSYKDDGNVECDILEKGSIHEYDDLFAQFEKDDSEFTSYPIRDTKVNSNYNFTIYKLKKSNNIIVTLKCKEAKQDIKVIINDDEKYGLSWDNNNDRLIITIALETVKEIGNVFHICIKYSGNENGEIINCFFNDYEAISNYRNAEVNDKNIAKKIMYKNDIFINDVLDLMYKMPNNAADIKRVKDTKKNYIEQKTETEESTDDEEYIINEEVLLEYKKKYEEDLEVNKAFNKVGNSYFNTIRDIISFGDEETPGPKSPHPENNNTGSPKTTIDLEASEEELELFNRRKGKRIIKKIVNGISTDNYIEEVNYYDYKSYIGMINIFFDKYTDYRSANEIKTSIEEKKDYLFEYTDSSESKFTLSSALFNLLLEEKISLEEEKEDILVLCFQSILQRIHSVDEYGVNDKYFRLNAQKLIRKIDEIYNIRDSYIDYVKKSLTLINYHKNIMSVGYAIGEIERLFDYKSIKRIKDIINMKEEHTLTQNNNNLILNVKTNETITFVKLKIDLLKNELNKYFKDRHNIKDKIDSFIIVVENPDVNLNNYDPVINIKLIWNEAGFRKIKTTKLNEIIEEIIEW